MNKFASTRLLNWCNIQVLTHCFLAFDRGPEKFALHLSTKYKFHLKAGWHDTPGKQHTIARRSNAIEQRANFGIGRKSVVFVPPFFRKRKNILSGPRLSHKEFNRRSSACWWRKAEWLSFYIAK